MNCRISGLSLAVAMLLSHAAAAAPYFEGFEDPGWTAGQPGNWQNFSGGDIQRVASGNAGITSSSGSGHAIITNLSLQNNVFNVPSLGASSPFTRFGGYSSSFGQGFTASIDVFLDPANWANGQGFDYSVAANRQNGNHLRDFIWHVGVVNGDLLVNASNNSDLSFNSFKLLNENGGNNHTVTAAGWYTLESVFFNNGGLLSVAFNLYDSVGTSLYSVTRNTLDDIASTVGGNRYGWLVYNNIDGLALDNVSLNLTSEVPEPSSLALAAISFFSVLGFQARRKRRRRETAA